MNTIKSCHIWKTTLFSAPALGYALTRIPALVYTRNGVLIAFCEGRDDKSDWADIDIIYRRSLDGGETWSNVRILLDGGGGPVSNATPIAGRDGALHFICQKNYKDVFCYRSEDDGLTWSEPREITSVFSQYKSEYNWKVVAPGPGHAIELKSGRLLVPVWLCDPAGAGVSGGDHRPSCVSTIASDDGGLTWKRGDIITDTTDVILNPSECTVAELADGRVMINIRSESKNYRRLVSVSADGLTGWTSPVFDEALYEPICMASFLSVADPKTKQNVLLFCNPDSHHDLEDKDALHFRSRSNGVIKLSRDGGKTWPEWRPIEGGRFGYSDLAYNPNGIVYCAYDTAMWGETLHHGWKEIVFARFPLDWIAANPFAKQNPSLPPPPHDSTAAGGGEGSSLNSIF